MQTQQSNTSTQRNTGFRAVIPFFILYDLELNANHLRFYCQIEQMESNPDPKVSPRFSYTWIAQQLGISRRNTICIAKVLKERGYIEHIQLKDNRWLWRTTKSKIIQSGGDASALEGGDLTEQKGGDPTQHNRAETSVVERHRGSDPGDHPPSDPGDHPKILEVKIPEIKTTTTTTTNIKLSNAPQKNVAEASSSCIVINQATADCLLQNKLPDDDRSDDEFLRNCKHHLEHNSDQALHIKQRIAGLKTILKACFVANERFVSRNYRDPERIAKTKAIQDEAYSALVVSQDAKYFATQGAVVPIKSAMTDDQRRNGIARCGELFASLGVSRRAN